MSNYRPDVDGLRALAVLLVVAFHAAPGLVPGGYVGVDIFFVISGFLITGILRDALQEGRFSFLRFYRNRAKRIFPALVVVLAFVLATGWFLLLPDQYANLGRHAAAGAAFVSNLLLWKEAGYFDAAAEVKPLLHLWSLGVEEQFYIAWPLLMLAVHKLRSRLLPPLVLIALASFAWNVYQVQGDPTAAFYSPFTRFWELALGAMLAVYRHPPSGADFPDTANGGRARQSVTRSSVIPDILAATGMASIAVAVVLLRPESRFPGWWALLPTFGAALLLHAGPGSWLGRRFLAARPMVWVGLVSYPLYLWHWPLLVFLRIRESGDPSAAQVLGVVVAAFVMAWLTYRFIEKPIRFAPREKIFQRVAGTCAALLVVLMAGLVVQARSGFVSRFPGQIQALAAFKYDPSVAYRHGTCFLLAKDPASALQECADGEKDPRKPVVLLWGDSYAAALYPGYRHVLEGKARLLQVNAVGCPPAVGNVAGGARCEQIAEQVMHRIRQEKVTRVVIAANWAGNRWPAIKPIVERALVELRRNGVRQIDVVGQLPEWGRTLPVELYEAYQRDHVVHTRLENELVNRRVGLEADLRAMAARYQARYISPTEVLCNAQGCLTMVGGRPENLTSFDRGHLTAAASKFLVERFPQ